MGNDEARDRVLAAAGRLFYARGITAVGMDDIRDASGVPLKRLYQCFPSKDRLVAAYLDRRDKQWMAALARCVDRHRDARMRLLAPFTFLGEWFASPDFRGCAFINAFGELGGSSPEVTGIVRRHKQRLRRYLAGLAAEAGARRPPALAARLLVLMEGAIVVAATGTSARAAAHAKSAARALLDSELAGPAGGAAAAGAGEGAGRGRDGDDGASGLSLPGRARGQIPAARAR
jgi:AcrR family transcriptional regulator